MSEVNFTALALPPLPTDSIMRALELEGRELVYFDPVPYMAPLIIGCCFDWICLGVVLCQMQRFMEVYHARERWHIRGMVYLLFLIALTTSGYVIYFASWGLAVEYARFWQFLDKTRSSTIFVLHALSRLPVGVYFAHRAWMLLGKSKVFLVAISVLSVVSLAGSIMGKIYFSTLVTARNVIKLAGYSLVMWLGCEVLSDILITGSIGVCLYKSRTGWSGTDKLINKLLFMVVETQLPPTLFAIAFMLVFFLKQDNTRFLIIFAGAPKVHIIALFAALNQRDKLRLYTGGSQHPNSTPVGGRSGSGMYSRSTDGVQIKTETHVHTEPAILSPITPTKKYPVSFTSPLEESDIGADIVRRTTATDQARGPHGSYPPERRVRSPFDHEADEVDRLGGQGRVSWVADVEKGSRR